MQRTALLLFTLILSTSAISQACLPDGIEFSNQADIDNFTINHPNCTEIEGNVYIVGSEIVGLEGLSALIAIDGNLYLGDTWTGVPNLASLNGLQNIVWIGGDLMIYSCEMLSNLDGLEGLTTIGGKLILESNLSMVNLQGLESLTSVHGLVLRNNYALTTLTGINNLSSIQASLSIILNPMLEDLTGLESLTSLSGGLTIYFNGELTNISALAGLSDLALSSLTIGNNWLLSNLHGLEGLDSVIYSMEISGNHSLVDLDGLNNLDYVGYDLKINFNMALSSLIGLENLSTTGDLTIFDNDALTHTDGLTSLNSINGEFWLVNNDELTEINSLITVKSLGGKLRIVGNTHLLSLNGLDSINPGSIDTLTVSSNDSLATCHVQSICDYLASPDAFVAISNNAAGCNSRGEVETACGVGFEVSGEPDGQINIYPNPATDKIIVELHKSLYKSELEVFDLKGQQLGHFLIPGPVATIDLTHFQHGVYVLKFSNDNMLKMYKIVKM